MKVKTGLIKKTRLDMLPLIDVVFLLLVFFIYAMLSMSMKTGVPVALPTSGTASQEKELILSVSVKGTGEVYVDETPVTMEQLSEVLTERIRGVENPGVLLFGDRDLAYQTLFHVIDRIRTAGISRVSLQSEGETP